MGGTSIITISHEDWATSKGPLNSNVCIYSRMDLYTKLLDQVDGVWYGG